MFHPLNVMISIYSFSHISCVVRYQGYLFASKWKFTEKVISRSKVKVKCLNFYHFGSKFWTFLSLEPNHFITIQSSFICIKVSMIFLCQSMKIHPRRSRSNLHIFLKIDLDLWPWWQIFITWQRDFMIPNHIWDITEMWWNH